MNILRKKPTKKQRRLAFPSLDTATFFWSFTLGVQSDWWNYFFKSRLTVPFWNKLYCFGPQLCLLRGTFAARISGWEFQSPTRFLLFWFTPFWSLTNRKMPVPAWLYLSPLWKKLLNGFLRRHGICVQPKLGNMPWKWWEERGEAKTGFGTLLFDFLVSSFSLVSPIFLPKIYYRPFYLDFFFYFLFEKKGQKKVGMISLVDHGGPREIFSSSWLGEGWRPFFSFFWLLLLWFLHLFIFFIFSLLSYKLIIIFSFPFSSEYWLYCLDWELSPILLPPSTGKMKRSLKGWNLLALAFLLRKRKRPWPSFKEKRPNEKKRKTRKGRKRGPKRIVLDLQRKLMTLGKSSKWPCFSYCEIEREKARKEGKAVHSFALFLCFCVTLFSFSFPFLFPFLFVFFSQMRKKTGKKIGFIRLKKRKGKKEEGKKEGKNEIWRRGDWLHFRFSLWSSWLPFSSL